MTINIMTVIGARPQFIKASVVTREFKRRDAVDETLVHTGQHYDTAMSDVFFKQMGIPTPDYNLDIQASTHGAMTARMLESLEALMIETRPDKVLVYGDTNSTLAGALAASKLHIPVVHVEAGLRSFNMKMPEEINRVLTDRLSQYLLCPTTIAIENLKAEGYGSMPVYIENTGDVMQDAALYYGHLAKAPSSLPGNLGDDGFVLATLHRAENTDDTSRLKNIMEALNEVHVSSPVVFTAHPRTQNILLKHGIKTSFPVLKPVGYFEMLWLLKNCLMVATDSGGLQKEAFFFGKPCITLRDETEWVELIDAGVNVLVGSNKKMIVSKYEAMRTASISSVGDLYGGGNAAVKIVNALLC